MRAFLGGPVLHSYVLATLLVVGLLWRLAP